MNQNRDAIALLILVIGGVCYSLVSFAYMHATFPSKEVFSLVVDKLDRLDEKLDKVIDDRSHDRRNDAIRANR